MRMQTCRQSVTSSAVTCCSQRETCRSRETPEQMLLRWCWWEKPEPFICQRSALEWQQHLIPSPSIDVITSICGQFALVIPYPSPFWAPGRDFYFSLIFDYITHMICNLMLAILYTNQPLYKIQQLSWFLTQMSNQLITKNVRMWACEHQNGEEQWLKWHWMRHVCWWLLSVFQKLLIYWNYL